jgi:putative endopeptidase
MEELIQMNHDSNDANTFNCYNLLRRTILRVVSGVVLLNLSTLGTSAFTLPVFAASPAFNPSTPPLGFSIDNMDKSVDPRVDFYRYATGTWLKQTTIPDSEADVGGFTQLAYNLDKQLLTLIKDAAATQAAPGSPRQQVGDYWRAAMDVKRIDEVGLKPLEADLKRIKSFALPGSPAALGELSARLELGFGISPLVNAFATPDAKDSTTYLLIIIAGQQALTQDEYAKADGQRVRELYVEYITRMFQRTGDSAQTAAAKARTVLSIESEISAAQLTPIQQRDPAMTYNKMTLAEAQALIPAVDLKTKLLALGVVPPATVQVRDIAALKAVNKVLTTRPPEELQTLLLWHVLSARASTLGQPWRGYDQEFNRQRKGLQTIPEREREVTNAISMQLFHPLSKLYVEAYFPESTRREITQMVGYIKDEFEQRLRTNPWLDEPTRATALDKLSKVDIQVGYPQQWIDFSCITIRADDHFGNSQRADEFQLRRQLARVGKPVVAERFATPPYTTPVSVNAAYNPQTNSIDITAAIVQPPFYVPGADAAVNYCTIGAVIGHELTHGFDSFGRQFGPKGNLRDWWTPQATAEFKKRTDVLVKQYSEFTLLPDVRHNGELTLTENTADLGGITLAYAALQRHLAGKPLTRIDYLTPDQRCFVAWTQMWSYKARPERIRLLATNDYHGNSTLRGYVPLLHLDAFHNAFGTRPGDPMWREPVDRIRIW